MLEAGRRYLESKCSGQELYGSTVDLATAIKFWGGHPAIGQVARDWSRMVDRYWNEGTLSRFHLGRRVPCMAGRTAGDLGPAR